jgi:PLP dependent protein
MSGTLIRDNLERIRERIEAACVRAGRNSESVLLIAVSKRIPLPLLVDACRAGQWSLGENRVQDALQRQGELTAALLDEGLPADEVDWHFIGHLQGNKAGRAGGQFALMHGVDSIKLAERLSHLAIDADRTDRILLEVNISGESQKHGFQPAEVAETVARISSLPGLELSGLMGMASAGASEGQLRETFASLRKLSEKAAEFSGHALPELSMGMSGDFEAAIAEGATMVRVGGAIFGPRQN